MNLTLLGSGTCVPSLQRNPCSALVTVGGRHLVIDCGPGTMRRLLEAGVTIFQIDALLLTHFHPDHTGELAALLFSRKYAIADEPPPPLTLVGGPGLLGFVQRLEALYGDWIVSPESPLAIIEQNPVLDPPLALAGMRIETGEVAHNPESVAYRITDGRGASLVVTGDTDVCASLPDFSAGADVLVCECSLPDELKSPGHLTPSLAGDIAARARVGRLVLTHFYPPCESVDIAAQCRKSWKGELILARDLMTLSIDPQSRPQGD